VITKCGRAQSDKVWKVSEPKKKQTIFFPPESCPEIDVLNTESVQNIEKARDL
jgi:hypothetical protein